MCRCPSTTPGKVSTSTSRIDALWISAKRRICACANLMSSIVCGATFATSAASSSSERRKLGGRPFVEPLRHFTHRRIAPSGDIGDDALDRAADPGVGRFLLAGQRRPFDVPGHCFLLFADPSATTTRCRQSRCGACTRDNRRNLLGGTRNTVDRTALWTGPIAVVTALFGWAAHRHQLHLPQMYGLRRDQAH